MNYYISDLHLNHINVTKAGRNFDNRPFETVEEMNKVIFENWNKGYHYCDPTTTRYFDSGFYEIKEDTVIGIAITKQKDKENNGIQYVLNNGNN